MSYQKKTMEKDGAAPGISREQIARWTKKIRAAFKNFDKDDKNTVPPEEVGSIIRYLGYFPSENDIVNIILPEMREEHEIGHIPYNVFEKKMLEIMATDEFDPDIYDTKLMHAFQVLDKDRNGYIDVSYMKKLLTTRGKMPFRPAEVDAFLKIATDKETGRIYYEDYVNMLTSIAEGVRVSEAGL